MDRFVLHPILAAAVALSAATAARGEWVEFHYSPQIPGHFGTPDSGVQLEYIFTGVGTAWLGDPAQLPGPSAAAHVTPGAAPVTFDERFDLELGVVDLASGVRHRFAVAGRLHGTLAEGFSDVRVSFPEAPLVARLGDRLYSLRVRSFDIPAPGRSAGGTVELTVTAAHAPEPSALALSAAAALCLATARRWRLRPAG